jgi:transposase
MRELELFSRALGLREPWRVVETRFDAERRRLDLRLDFERGARFACPECERPGCEVHDTSEQSWRH